MPQKDTNTLIELMTDMKDELKDVRKDFQKHKEEMQPIIDGWKTVQGIRSFVVWISVFIVMGGAIMAFIKGVK